MPQAVWVGQLCFGLVNIPVKLYSATASKNVRFHQYDAQTGRRIRYRRVAAGLASERPVSSDDGGPREQSSQQSAPQSPAEPARIERASGLHNEPEVQWDDIVKGFEVEPGKVVPVTAEELESLRPERTRALEVEEFVPLADIDPVYFDKSYYVAPAGVGAERPYGLLHRAMKAGAEVAVGRFVMRTKEYLTVVRPGEHLLILETLFYPDEVRNAREIWRTSFEEPTEQELQVARQFIEALAGSWEPDRQRDEYRERLLDLMRAKSDETDVLQPAASEPLTQFREELSSI